MLSLVHLHGLHFHGVVLGPSGFAAEGREWLACLERAGLHPSLAGARLGEHDGRLRPVDAARLTRCAARPRQAGGVDWHHLLIPHFCRLPGAGHTVLHSVFETESLPAQLAARTSDADTVVVLSEWNRQGFTAGGVAPDKLVVLPPPFDADAFQPPATRTRPANTPFRWLSVFDWTLRKGPDLLLAAFGRAFRHGEAELLIKTVPAAGRASGTLQAEADARLRAVARGRPPVVTVVESVCDDDAMAKLYAGCDGFVLASRGEAWGRPVHEAMLTELPVVVPAAHALATLVPSDAVGYPVPARLVPVADAAAVENPWFRGQAWHEVDVDALAHSLRAVQSSPHDARRRAQRGRAHVLGLCDRDRLAAQLRTLLQRMAATVA